MSKPGEDNCWHCASLSAGDRACVFHRCTAQACNCAPLAPIRDVPVTRREFRTSPVEIIGIADDEDE